MRRFLAYFTNCNLKGRGIVLNEPSVVVIDTETKKVIAVGKEAKEMFPKDKPMASDCIKCGKCENNCPQSIEIRKHLEKIAEWEK